MRIGVDNGGAVCYSGIVRLREGAMLGLFLWLAWFTALVNNDWLTAWWVIAAMIVAMYRWHVRY